MSTRKRNKLGNDPLGWLDAEDGTDHPQERPESGESGATEAPGDDAAAGAQDAPENPAGDTPEDSGPPTGTSPAKKPAARRSRKKTAASSKPEHSQNTSSEDTAMAAKSQSETPSAELDDQFMRAACEGASMSVMMCDPDMNIIFANPSVVELLRNRKESIRERFPHFDPDNLVGQSIDQFHENSAHQRAILQDPSRLPWEAEIEVADLEFKLKASAIVDDQGQYLGNMVEWTDVTERNRFERELARMRSAFEGSAQAQMMADTDLRVTYANPAAQALLHEYRKEIQEYARGFDPLNPRGCNLAEIYQDAPRESQGGHAALPAKHSLRMGDLQIELKATPLTDEDGNHSGYMVEWEDVTDLRQAEANIDALIRDAARGKLDERLTPDDYDGFVKNIAEGVNELLDAVVPPLREGSRVMQAMSEGDLTARLEGNFQGEFAEFRDAIHTTMDNLDQLVGQILEGANNVRSASSEIAQGNTDLSQRTEEQASSLEETASSMEEMTSTVKSNADNAKQARQLATAARDKASEGGDVVTRAVTAMGEINQSSKKISDIIGVIDEIAFQTNLLALNAAVEAARAGEQGRGFAVVATEVRNLAQRSAQAAKEIKSLISDSVEKVDEGTKLVDASGKSLEEIVESVKKVSDIIAEIAAASEEQSTGLDEINKAVSQLDEVTQQNAALVEEAASASESLDDQARELLELMAFFKGSRTEMAPAPAASAPRTSGGAGGGAGQGAGAARPATRSSEAKQPRRPASARSGETAQSARDSKPAARARSQAADGGGEEWEEF